MVKMMIMFELRGCRRLLTQQQFPQVSYLTQISSSKSSPLPVTDDDDDGDDGDDDDNGD